MSSAKENDALANINRLVDAFGTTKPAIQDAHSPELFFLESSKEEAARKMGDVFWLPMPRAYKIFCYAYSALFGIPAFTSEAVDRQGDRFSYKRLPLTIRSTSGFILDGFGYNRRTERHRKEIYLPGPVIRSVHGNNAKQNKMRISDPAMAYFGYHLIRAAKQFTTPAQCDNIDNLHQQHYDYVSSFFRTGGYPFPHQETQAHHFSTQTDQTLAGNTYAEYWHNIIHAAEELDTTLDLEHLANFLPKRTSAFFRQTVL